MAKPPAAALRYYDKEGLLPFVERSASGIRRFKESDFDWLAMINCLKDSGMSVKKIKSYVDWSMEGNATLAQRVDFMKEHKAHVEAQMATLEDHMTRIVNKIDVLSRRLEEGA